MSENNDIFAATPENIWNYRQNHPELVIEDCRRNGFSDEQIEVVRQSMLCRGVNKWLKVRRDLIAHKKALKNRIRSQNHIVTVNKHRAQNLHRRAVDVEKGKTSVQEYADYCLARQAYLIEKERLKWLQKERGVLKGLCMTDRWQIWKDRRLEDMNTIRAPGN